MAFVKAGLDDFKVNLKGGKYANPTGARRAVGKLSTLSSEEKDKARKMIDAHFGEPSQPKAAAPKAPVRTPVTAAAKKPVVQAAAAARAPRASGIAPAARKLGRPPKAKTASMLPPPPSDLHQHTDDLSIGERIVSSSTSALTSLQNVQNAYSGIDTKSAAEAYTGTLSSAVHIFRRVLNDRLGIATESVETSRTGNSQHGRDEEPYFPELSVGQA